MTVIKVMKLKLLFDLFVENILVLPVVHQFEVSSQSWAIKRPCDTSKPANNEYLSTFMLSIDVSLETSS